MIVAVFFLSVFGVFLNCDLFPVNKNQPSDQFVIISYLISFLNLGNLKGLLKAL